MLETPVSPSSFLKTPIFWLSLILVLAIGFLLTVTHSFKTPARTMVRPAYHIAEFGESPQLSAYIGLVGHGHVLYTARADGSQLQQISSAGPLHIEDAKFSPDGKLVLFRGSDSYFCSPMQKPCRERFPDRLYWVSSEGGERHLVAEEATWNYHWMSDSRHVMYLARDINHVNSAEHSQSLYRFDIVTEASEKVFENALDYIISPDERQIVVALHEPNHSYREAVLVMVRADSREETRITSTAAYNTLVGWLDDAPGQFLHTNAQDLDFNSNRLFVSSIKGGESSLQTDLWVDSVALSPDARLIAYADPDGMIFVAPINSISITPTLAFTSTVEGQRIYDMYRVVWEPDGRGFFISGSRPLTNPSDLADPQINIFWFDVGKTASYACPAPCTNGHWLPGRPTVVYETGAYADDPFFNKIELYDLVDDRFIQLFPDLPVTRTFDWRLAQSDE